MSIAWMDLLVPIRDNRLRIVTFLRNSVIQWSGLTETKQLIKTQKIFAKRVCNISPSVWQWIRDNFLTDEKETWENSDGIREECREYHIVFKKNESKKILLQRFRKRLIDSFTCYLKPENILACKKLFWR